MATTRSRSMSAEFYEGTVDNSYIALAPDRVGGWVPVERLTWPSYAAAEQHVVSPFEGAIAARAGDGRKIELTR